MLRFDHTDGFVAFLVNHNYINFQLKRYVCLAALRCRGRGSCSSFCVVQMLDLLNVCIKLYAECWTSVSHISDDAAYCFVQWCCRCGRGVNNRTDCCVRWGGTFVMLYFMSLEWQYTNAYNTYHISNSFNYMQNYRTLILSWYYEALTCSSISTDVTMPLPIQFTF